MSDFRSLARRLYSFRYVVLKALIFGAAWYLLPAWLFVFVALYFYFVPFFRTGKFLPSFIAVLAIYFLAPATLAYALVGAILFGWLLGIRDLLFIDRRLAYEVLVLGLVFFLLRLFYMANEIISGGSFLGAFLMAILLSWMLYALMRAPGIGSKEGQGGHPAIMGWLSMLFFWEILTICLFLPLDFIYQSVIAFLLAVPVIDFLPAWFWGQFSRSKGLAMASVVFGGLVLVLASAL
jgi:hypothetical protein